MGRQNPCVHIGCGIVRRWGIYWVCGDQRGSQETGKSRHEVCLVYERPELDFGP